MSISPNKTQGSNSSSSFIPSANPNSQHHGFLPHSPHSLHSPPFSTSPNSPGGSSLSAPPHSGRSVTELGVADNNVMPNQESHSSRRGGGGGGGRSRGKSSATQHNSGYVASHGNSPQPAGRRSQMMNGNHLLNFHYDPITRPQPRGPPPPPARRQHKRRPYNKDLFLQANYKFVVLDSGNYSTESMDPDKKLRWEDIICVRYSTPTLVQCPICLEYPLCPQITSCGHIFCFPCILQYLLMGKEDHQGESWKRCPLCFVMISPKDLYTLFVENVKQYTVGDSIDFMLLSRQKDSFTISRKSKQEKDTVSGFDDENYDPFTKFTFTSDVDRSVRKAISELDAWLVRADAGLVDDIEKLPYVSAAMEQLEQRKKYWNEHRGIDSNKTDPSVVLPAMNPVNGNSEASITGDGALSNSFIDLNKCSESVSADKSDDGTSSDQSVDATESLEGHENHLSSSYDENKTVQLHSRISETVKDNKSYNFYQAADGQHMILHPLNMKCLLHHYGSHDMLPHRISGRILQLETVTQSEAMRRRYRYLSHFSLTTILQLCEIDLSELLSPDDLSPFIEEIKKRERQRKQLAKKERTEQMKAESAMAYPIPIIAGFAPSFRDESPTFSMDDFEALGSSSVTLSSPLIVGERRLFSSVTKLGFAAGHDSPSLNLDGTNSLNDHDAGSSIRSTVMFCGLSTGTQNAGVSSFANIISRAKTEENLDAPKINGSGKKGKKQSRVLLSTTGGRRY